MKTSKITLLAFYTTLALIIYAVESMIPPLVPIPGIKLGLANIITLVLLRNASGKEALLALFMRILLSTFFFSQAVSLLYSLTGGLLCFAAMFLINRLLKKQYLFLTGIIGGIFHNLGQIAIAFLLARTVGVLSFVPFLMVSGILTGLFTGLCAHYTGKYLPLNQDFSE